MDRIQRRQIEGFSQTTHVHFPFVFLPVKKDVLRQTVDRPVSSFHEANLPIASETKAAISEGEKHGKHLVASVDAVRRDLQHVKLTRIVFRASTCF